MFYTVEWGHYIGNNQVQDGDIEIEAKDEKDAINKSGHPKEVEWVHAYSGVVFDVRHV